jgi:YD repeat-containing protein
VRERETWCSTYFVGGRLQRFDYTTDAENQAPSETAHDAEAVHYDYSYDADRRLTEADASDYGAPRKREYTYDPLDNLEQIASTDHTQSVQCDKCEKDKYQCRFE